MPASQAELFPSPQPDLFGGPAAPPAYVVPYPIAVNTLTKTLALLQGSARWPWDADMKAARMERTVPKLLDVLPPDEAADWRARIDEQVARLNAAQQAA